MKLLLCICLLLVNYFAVAQKKFSPSENYKRHAARALGFYEQKEYLKSALSYDSLFKQNKGRGLRSDKYNAACSWALAGNADKAFLYLDKAVLKDKWKNLSHILSDADLKTLHADQRWQPLIDSVRANKERAEAKLNKPLVAILDTVYNEDQSDRKKLDTIQKQFGRQSTQVDS
jgi:hypothetical protein